MLVVTWNVNSLNARMPRVLEFLEKHQPDAVCLQETKCAPDSFPHLELQAAGYVAADHSGGRWAGVAILTREDAPPHDVQIGLPGEPVDEARWVEATVGGVRIASVYVINGRAIDDDMFPLKLQMLDAMAARAEALADDPLMILGDFNVAPRDEDVYDPAAFDGSTHVTPDERGRLAAIQEAARLEDAFLVAPDRGEHEYTWWDYRAGNFHKNKGLRIDLALTSPDITERLEWVGIDRDFRKGTKPSDHAPLLVRLRD